MQMMAANIWYTYGNCNWSTKYVNTLAR